MWVCVCGGGGGVRGHCRVILEPQFHFILFYFTLVTPHLITFISFIFLPTYLCSLSHFSRYQNSFYGVDLSNLRDSALLEYFRQPIVVSVILNI